MHVLTLTIGWTGKNFFHIFWILRKANVVQKYKGIKCDSWYGKFHPKVSGINVSTTSNLLQWLLNHFVLLRTFQICIIYLNGIFGLNISISFYLNCDYIEEDHGDYWLLLSIRLRKINAMSQSSWQIGRPDLNAFFLTFFFFFFFFWAANLSDLSRSQLWNMELDFGWTRYKAEHKSLRSLLFKVFHCVCHIFSCVFWQASHKKLKEKSSKQKKFKPWILLNQTRTEKQMRAAALRHMIYFFSLIIVAL